MTNCKIPILVLCLLFSIGSKAQLSKDFDLQQAADGQRIVLNGDRSTPIPFSWTNASLNQADVLITYIVQFDRFGKDFSIPLANVDVNCCPDVINGTSLNMDAGQWAAFLKGLNSDVFGEGDSLVLSWRVQVSAIKSGCATCPVYEYRNSQQTHKVTFVRGIFDDELRPFALTTPHNGFHYTVKGDANGQLDFSWNASSCPTDCGAPEYRLLVDTFSGDFTTAVHSQTLPAGTLNTSVDNLVLAGILDMMGANIGDSRTIYWRVAAFSGKKYAQSISDGNILLTRDLLNHENQPYENVVPKDGYGVSLMRDSGVVVFRCERTWLPQVKDVVFQICIDTLGGSDLFLNPMLLLPGTANGVINILNIYNFDLRAQLDAHFGTSWKEKQLKWTTRTIMNSTYYYAEKPFLVTFYRNTNPAGLAERSQQEILVYPNPFNHMLTVREAGEISEVSLKDMQGKTVLHRTTQEDTGEIQINTEMLRPGFYFIEIRTEGGTVIRKVVK